ncbi:MAG TPA: haloacid dehalogenase [Cellvibrio sp.]|nr:haloacid dehalogenase [Cellvibrio sp.]
MCELTSDLAKVLRLSSTLHTISNLTKRNDAKAKAVNSPENPKVVIFDLYGTLVKFGVMHHPFRQLLKWARENGRKPKPDDARTLMTVNGDVPALVAALGIDAPDALLKQIQLHIQEELSSLTLYDDVIPTLTAIRRHNIPIAICSNLAFPYGKAIDLLPEGQQLTRGLSYETGFIKPESGIYHAIICQLHVRPEECLFVGDTLLADYEGPRQFGMHAYHLVRGTPSTGHSINSLADVLTIMQ